MYSEVKGYSFAENLVDVAHTDVEFVYDGSVELPCITKFVTEVDSLALRIKGVDYPLDAMLMDEGGYYGDYLDDVYVITTKNRWPVGDIVSDITALVEDVMKIWSPNYDHGAEDEESQYTTYKGELTANLMSELVSHSAGVYEEVNNTLARSGWYFSSGYSPILWGKDSYVVTSRPDSKVKILDKVKLSTDKAMTGAELLQALDTKGFREVFTNMASLCVTNTITWDEVNKVYTLED